MFLNLSSLAHPLRTVWWKQHPPARLYAIDDIVCWPNAEQAPPHHFMQHRYFWAVWEAYHSGPSSFRWLSASDFRQQPQKLLNIVLHSGAPHPAGSIKVRCVAEHYATDNDRLERHASLGG